MIQLTDKIWIGNSSDEKSSQGMSLVEIGAVLNVAQDMDAYYGWGNGIEVMHVGLIDGPGNEQAAYCAAILALHTLLQRNHVVLVCCHSGGRALAVVVMYLVVKGGKVSTHPTFLNYWRSWDIVVTELCGHSECSMPEVHRAHIEAFDKLPLALLEMML